MLINLDASVFSSATTAHGYASGEMEIASLPEAGEVFPWPEAWVRERPSWFAPKQSVVLSVRTIQSGVHIQLHGIVCSSIAEAEDCARYLEEHGGLFFDRYGQRGC
jgi:hypothetical protein